MFSAPDLAGGLGLPMRLHLGHAEEKVSSTLHKVTKLMLGAEHERAKHELEALKGQHETDDGLARLAKLLVFVVQTDRAHHERKAAAQLSDVHAPSGPAAVEASTEARGPRAPAGLGTSPGGPRQHATHVRGAPRREDWMKQLAELKSQRHPSQFPGLVSAWASAAEAYAELLGELSDGIQGPLFGDVERFVCPRPVASALRGLREKARTFAVRHPFALFGELLERLSVEAEMFEAFLMAEFRCSLLNAGAALADLSRASRLLDRYLGMARDRGRRTLADAGGSATSSYNNLLASFDVRSMRGTGLQSSPLSSMSPPPPPVGTVGSLSMSMAAVAAAAAGSSNGGAGGTPIAALPTSASQPQLLTANAAPMLTRVNSASSVPGVPPLLQTAPGSLEAVGSDHWRRPTSADGGSYTSHSFADGTAHGSAIGSLGLSMGARGQDGSYASSPGHFGIGVAARGQDKLSSLERWYCGFYAHCYGKLQLFCGGGLDAARRWGLSKAATPGSVGAAAAAPASGLGLAGSARSGEAAAADAFGAEHDPLVGKADPSFLGRYLHDGEQILGFDLRSAKTAYYLKDLWDLSEKPEVVLIGIFVNARQLPQLRGLTQRAAAGLVGGACSVSSDPLKDAAWLVPLPGPSGDGLGEDSQVPCDVPDYDWWSLYLISEATFEATPSSSSSRADRTSSGAQADVESSETFTRQTTQPAAVGSAASRRRRCGAHALDARHGPMLRALRAALCKACRERHVDGGGSVTGYSMAGAQSTGVLHSGAQGGGGALPTGGASFPSFSATSRKPPHTPPTSLQVPGGSERKMNATDLRWRSFAPGVDRSVPSSMTDGNPDPSLSPVLCPTAADSTTADGSPGGLSSEAFLGRESAAAAPMVEEVQAGMADGFPSEAGQLRCMVVPLDQGWFPSPLFMGLVARCPPRSSMLSINVGSLAGAGSATAGTAGAPLRSGLGAGVPPRPSVPVGDGGAGSPSHGEQRMSFGGRSTTTSTSEVCPGGPRWWRKMRSMFGSHVEPPAPGPSADEELAEVGGDAVERSLLQLATAASGLRLRREQAFDAGRATR